MKHSTPSVVLPVAVLGVAALMASGSSAPARADVRHRLLSGPRQLNFTGLLDGDVRYPARISPSEVVAFFEEWRPDHGPAGATRIHIRHPYMADQIYVRESIDIVKYALGLPLVKVTWRPDWMPMSIKPPPEQKAAHHEVWINPKQVSWIGRSNIYSQEKRQVLGSVYLADGFMLDKLLETWPEIKELFEPYGIPYRGWRRNGRQ